MRSPTPITCRLIAASLALSAAVLAPAPAGAQSAKDIAAARAAFRAGEAAEAKGDYPTALARFQAALAVKATPQLHLRIGAVQEKLGRLADALASYQQGLDKAASLPAVAKIAKEQIDAIKPRIPTLTVSAAKPPPGLSVTVDDQPLAPSAFGTALPLEVGPHRLHAEAPGYAPRDRAFDAVERGATRIELDLAPLPAPTAPASDKPAPVASKLPGALAIGGGAAALVVGAVLIGVSAAKDGNIDALCGGSDRLRCPLSKKAQIEGDVSSVNAMRFSGIGVGVLGAAGVAVGAFMLVKAAKPAPATGAAVQVVPLAGAGMAGVMVVGRF